MAAATDASHRSTRGPSGGDCLNRSAFVPSLVEGKIVICTCAVYSDVDGGEVKATIADIMKRLGAAGFILVAESAAGSDAPPTVATVSIDVPGAVITSSGASKASPLPLHCRFWSYYASLITIFCSLYHII